MGKYWDWYEVEFERVAKRKLSHERAEEILDSIREHVRDAVSEFSVSRPEAEAERLAVRSLGSPTEIIEAELDTGSRQWLPVWTAGLGTAWCAIWMMIGPTDWTMPMVWAGMVITPIAVFFATLISKRIKLWALGGTVALIGAAMLATLCFTWLDLRAVGASGVLPRWQVASESKFLEEEISGMSERMAKISTISAAFKSGDMAHAKSLAFQTGRGWMTPMRFRLGYEHHNASWVQSFEASKEVWRLRSSSVLSDFKQRQERAIDLKAAIRDGRAFNPTGLFVSNFTSFVGVSLTTYLALSLFHIMGLLMVRMPSSRARRSWRLAL